MILWLIFILLRSTWLKGSLSFFVSCALLEDFFSSLSFFFFRNDSSDLAGIELNLASLLLKQPKFLKLLNLYMSICSLCNKVIKTCNKGDNNKFFHKFVSKLVSFFDRESILNYVMLFKTSVIVLPTCLFRHLCSAVTTFLVGVGLLLSRFLKNFPVVNLVLVNVSEINGSLSLNKLETVASSESVNRAEVLNVCQKWRETCGVEHVHCFSCWSLVFKEFEKNSLVAYVKNF